MTFQEKVKDYFNSILEKPVLTTFIVLIILVLIVVATSWTHYSTLDDNSFLRDVLVESHGTLFDLVVIGILILWLNQMGERKLRVRSYQDEIDDFRDWKADESKFRVIGNIRRLNRDNITKMSLYNYNLGNMVMNHLDLNESNLNYSNFGKSKLTEMNLKNSLMNQVDFSNSQINTTNLFGAKLNGANFSEASAILCNFESCHMINTNLENAYFLDANFKNCIFWESNFKNASFYRVDFSKSEGITAEMILSTKIYRNCTFDADLLAEIDKLKKESMSNRS